MKAVLVPIDGSDCSLRAVRYLISGYEGGLRPALYLVNVQPAMTHNINQFVARAEIDDYRREQSELVLRDARALLDSAGIPYEVHVEVGHAADRIVACSVALNCDHIVMGTHGRTALAELVIGSTTLRVLHRTELPVLLVK